MHNFLGIPLIGHLAALLALPFIFWLVQLVDVARRHFPEPTAKPLWVLVVLLGSVPGAIVYYFVGKKQGSL